MTKYERIAAHPDTYTAGRGGHPVQYIVVHYTATQASAKNNAQYFAGGNRNSSAHYFIDGGGTIYQSVSENDTAWAVGNWNMNQQSISIEVVSDGREFSECEIEELSSLVQDLMNRYSIPASRVIRHYDVVDQADCTGSTISPHKLCPRPYIDNSAWNELHARITGARRIGWLNDARGWWYQLKSGYAIGWKQIDGSWYYFNKEGYMLSGFQKIGDYCFYLNEEHDGSYGAMLTGWINISDNWYLTDANGALYTSTCVQTKTGWYCFDDTGRMLRELKTDENGAIVL